MASRAVRSAGYDAEAQVLEIEFQSGGVYQYDGVPNETWAWFVRAPSKTAFVNNIIKPRYPFRNVSAPPANEYSEDGLIEALLRSLSQRRGR